MLPNPVEEVIHPLLIQRRSPRAFLSRPIPSAILSRCIEAVRWTPSCYNDQPWRLFLGVRGQGLLFDHLYQSLSKFNQGWNDVTPVLVLFAAQTNFSKTGKPNYWAEYDVGQAAAHFTFQAMDEGLFVHQMAGFDRDLLKSRLQLGTDSLPLTVMAVGYLGEARKLPPDLQARENAENERQQVVEFLNLSERGDRS